MPKTQINGAASIIEAMDRRAEEQRAKGQIFFDSHGGPWLCLGYRTDDPQAVAFGPAGCAKKLETVDGLEIGDGESAHAAAERAGRVSMYGQWPMLTKR